MDSFDRCQQLTALTKAWLAEPGLDQDVERAAMLFRHSDDRAAQLTRGLCDGFAYELADLESEAELLVAEGEALARLVAHVQRTNPRARRRARRRTTAPA